MHLSYLRVLTIDHKHTYCVRFEQKESTCVASLLERERRAGDVMTHRTCGVVYYAAALPPFLNERTEVYLVQKLDKGYIVAVPTLRDPAHSVTVVEWEDQDSGEEKEEVVVYGRVEKLSLRPEKPAKWATLEHRAFTEEVPLLALVSHIPPSVDVGGLQTKDAEEQRREPPKPTGEPDKTDEGANVPALQDILTAVGNIAAEVKQLKEGRGFPPPAQDPRLFGDLERELDESIDRVDAMEALRRARAAAGGPPAHLGGSQQRRPTDGAIPEPRRASGSAGDDPMALMAELLTRLLRGRTDREEEVDTEGLGGATGVKGIEKMEALRKRFANYPGERTRHVKDKVEQMLRDQNSRGLEAFVQTHSQIHRDKVSLCMAALFCDIIRAADDKDFARVSDIACGGILCLDQFHISGNLDLAWNLTLLPDPASLRVHKDKPTVAAVAKSKAHGRHRFSALAEPKVVAAALNEWKNYENMAKLENDA